MVAKVRRHRRPRAVVERCRRGRVAAVVARRQADRGDHQRQPEHARTRSLVVDARVDIAHSIPAPTGAVTLERGLGRQRERADRGRGRGHNGDPARRFRAACSGSTRARGSYRPLGWLENFPSLIDMLPDGRLVLSSLMARQNLREVTIGARTLVDGRWLTSGLAIDRQPVYSPDGRSVMFSSNRGGTLDLWEVSVETGEMHRVTDDPEDDWDPDVQSRRPVDLLVFRPQRRLRDLDRAPRRQRAAPAVPRQPRRRESIRLAGPALGALQLGASATSPASGGSRSPAGDG